MAQVYPIRNLLAPGLVAELRAALQAEGAPWVDGQQTVGRDGTKKRNHEIAADSPLRQELSDKVSAYLRGPLTNETLAFRHVCDPRRWSPFLFSRTGPGGGYRDHMDSAVMFRGSPEEMRSDLSMTIFLTEPDSYQGGELVVDSDMPYAPTFKMAAGGAVLYATNAIHRVAEVTAGERLVAVTWIESRIADVGTRQINADLLQVMSVLTRDGACDPEIRESVVTKLEKVRSNVVKRHTA
jgi:PKHD-type hydroxylase